MAPIKQGIDAAEMVKKHSGEAFYVRDDHLEAAVFSVLLEMVTKVDKADQKREESILPTLYDLDHLLRQPAISLAGFKR